MNSDEFISRLLKNERIRNAHIDRLAKIVDGDFIEKVIQKYDSPDYKNRWYRRAIFPPETLLWYLYYVAREYGRECDQTEWEQYSSDFTTQLYEYCGYYFNRMDGQGSLIRVIKKH